MSLLIVGAMVAVLPLALVFAVARPALTILPLYAATLPVASVIKLSVPLPDPFNTLSSVLGGAAILVCLGHILFFARGRVPTPPVGIWLAFLGWALLTTFWALRTTSAIGAAQIAIPLILLMVVVSALPVDDVDLSAMRLAIIASGIAVGMYALFLLLTGAPLPTHGQGTGQRLALASNPQDTNPNILAVSLILPLVLSVERIAFGGSRWWGPMMWRILGVTGVFFSSLAILLTGSRGGTLAAIVALLLALHLCARQSEGRATIRRLLRSVFYMGAGTVLLFMAGRILFPQASQAPQVQQRLAPVVAVLERLTNVQNRGSGRLEIWTGGYRACLAHCVWGAGLGNFEEAYTQSFAFSAASANVGLDRPAHNIYLGLAVETGVIGLTLLVLALFVEWIQLSGERVRRVSPAIRAALFGLVVAEIFLSAIWFKYFWLLFILIRITDGAAARHTVPLPEHGGVHI